MSVFYINENAVAVGVPVRVYERDELGLLLAEYKGYYDHRSDCYTLYPSYNPFAAMNGKTHKRTIPSAIVRFPR